MPGLHLLQGHHAAAHDSYNDKENLSFWVIQTGRKKEKEIVKIIETPPCKKKKKLVYYNELQTSKMDYLEMCDCVRRSVSAGKFFWSIRYLEKKLFNVLIVEITKWACWVRLIPLSFPHKSILHPTTTLMYSECRILTPSALVPPPLPPSSPHF